MPRILFFLFFLSSYCISAQILPKEGSSLNYRLAGFLFPAEADKRSYKLEIARGYYNSADSFKKNIIFSTETGNNKVLAAVPDFGKNYTWRVIADGKKPAKGLVLHHFSTQFNARVDTSKLRLRILHPAEKYGDAYVGVDAGGVVYDMKGQPVWYVPEINGYGGNVADMKFTPEGTVTFIYRHIYEIDLSGNVLWESPVKTIVNGDTTVEEFYHHEFTKLSNGHYMVLGMRILLCKAGTRGDSSYVVMSEAKDIGDKSGYKQGKFGRILEYDEKGNVVWSWETSKYLASSDFAYYNPQDSFKRFDPHDNAFFYDEKNKVIYLGFRNLNRVVAIEYPSGKVLHTYGEAFKPGAKSNSEGFFCGQHSISRTNDGFLYYYNNNSCKEGVLPAVTMLQELKNGSEPIKKVWEYNCTIADGYSKIFNSGGNAIELPDGSMFVDMGSNYSKLFIVTKDKELIWSALPEKFIDADDKWEPCREYRASIISRQLMEDAIFKAESHNK